MNTTQKGIKGVPSVVELGRRAGGPDFVERLSRVRRTMRSVPELAE